MLLTFDDLKPHIPSIFTWAHIQERRIRTEGFHLSPIQVEIARKVGVLDPLRVRVLVVSKVPILPPHLAEFAAQVKLPIDDSPGMTYGWGIFICNDHVADPTLLPHELTHVRQCEGFGGVELFMVEYCKQVIEFGYWDAPLEIEAREVAETFRLN